MAGILPYAIRCWWSSWRSRKKHWSLSNSRENTMASKVLRTLLMLCKAIVNGKSSKLSSSSIKSSWSFCAACRVRSVAKSGRSINCRDLSGPLWSIKLGKKERVANWWNRAYTIKCKTDVKIERDQRMQGLNVKVLSRNHGSEFSFNKRSSIKVGTGHRTGSSGLSVEVSAGVNVGRGWLTSKEIQLSKKRNIRKIQQTITVAWWFHWINYCHLMQHPQKEFTRHVQMINLRRTTSWIRTESSARAFPRSELAHTPGPSPNFTVITYTSESHMTG